MRRIFISATSSDLGSTAAVARRPCADHLATEPLERGDSTNGA